MKLGDRSYRLLHKVSDELLLRPQVSRSRKLATVRELIAWCEQHQLPTLDWLTADNMIFTSAVLDSINLLLTQLNWPQIGQVHSGQSRLEQMENHDRESKSLGRPMDNRLLVLLASQQPPQLLPCAGLAVDADLAQISHDNCPVLLTVENLDVFYQLLEHQQAGYWQLPQQLQQALIVYRGHHKDAANVNAVVAKYRQAGKPAIYLGDFDPAGLKIAISLGYSHVLLPELEFLRKHCTTQHNPARQVSQHQWLARQQLSVQMQPFLALLLKDFRGLLQQRFRGPLQAIALHADSASSAD